MIVEWRPVLGYEGFYEVSNTGLVRSIPRITVDCNGLSYPRKGKVLSSPVGRSGYKYVCLSKKCCCRRFPTYKLVLEAFTGKSGPDLQVCHNDGNKLNNVLSNLRWGTRSENMFDRTIHGTATDLKGEKSPSNKLKTCEVWLIKKLLSYRIGQKTISIMFKISTQSISAINCGHSWRHLKYEVGNATT